TQGNLAIGHTRWATHGKVCKANAHPFVSFDGNFAVVHNGIVENYQRHKIALQRQGVEFDSTTDSEVVAHLLAKHFDGNVVSTIKKVASMLTGSFAVVVATAFDGNLYAFRRGSAMCVGRGSNGVCVCSDVTVVGQFASSVAVLPDGCVARLSKEGITAYVGEGKVALSYFEPACDGNVASQAEGDFMLSEIMQIPKAVRQTFDYYFASGGLCLGKKEVKRIKQVYFVGCGTAYHSALVACSLLQKFTNLSCQAVIASEYVYDNYFTNVNTLVVAISQSGETADTLKAVEKAKKRGAMVYAITNVCNSSLCFGAHYVKYIKAGREVSVASTKAYNCQLVALTLLVLDLATQKGCISARQRKRYIADFAQVPAACHQLTNQAQRYMTLASKHKEIKAAYFVGRRLDIATAKEGALKLKEISYVFAEAYPCGELKHGTLAVMDSDVLVVAVSCERELVDKCSNTIAEVTSRGATALVVSPYEVDASKAQAVVLPSVNEIFAPIVAVIPLQLFAYYFAKQRNCDVDRPRNLAKSVTVE
ncbi:MAG: glutamine--fructose-6-phosphate transaminase (isomerizing), partial [Clostridia bacterium]|nr:glutamine--fructose-6-phosphate transaminase (isomerizing) [Clostridia bacterium]